MFSARLKPWLLAGSALVLCAGWAAWRSYEQSSERQAIAIALTGGDPVRAPALMTRYGCGGCHTIPSVPGADGQVAAPLKGLRSRVYLAGVLPNTADNLIAWMLDPTAYSPRTAMPSTGLTQDEARDIAAWLYGS